ncbi:MAG: ABC transporter ATP-binding protein, partial [Planctomycetota bacterium]
DLTVLNDVSIEVPDGEFVAIRGPSGSGKSTLLALLAGLERPSSGSVSIGGRRIDNLSEDDLAILRRKEIGFVFQSFQLLENLTARENILLPLELLGVDGAAQRSDELLTRLGISERGHHYPAELSGGEKQRVAIARAFGPQPAVLLADEPTGNLDRDNGERVLELIADLQQHEGTTLILVTHDAEIAARASREIHLRAGQIEFDRNNGEIPSAAAPLSEVDGS